MTACRTERQAHAALTREQEHSQDVHELLDYLLASVEQERETIARLRRERRTQHHTGEQIP